MNNNWPTDDHITSVALNGEVDAPIYEISGVLYRKNPVGRYSLYWSGKAWRESATVTNDRLTNGEIK